MGNDIQFSAGGPIIGTGVSLLTKIIIAIIAVFVALGAGYFGYNKFIKSSESEITTNDKKTDNGAVAQKTITPLPACDQLVRPEFMLSVGGFVKVEGKPCTYVNPNVDPNSRVINDQDTVTISGYCQEDKSWEDLEKGMAFMAKGGQSNMEKTGFESALNEVGRGSYRFYSIERDTKTRTVEFGNAMFLGSNKKCFILFNLYTLPKDVIVNIAKEIDNNLK